MTTKSFKKPQATSKKAPVAQNRKNANLMVFSGRDTKESDRRIFAEGTKANGVAINSAYSRPDPSIFGLRDIHINELLCAPCDTYAQACGMPDVLQVVYTFNFPQSCAEFRKLFGTDFYVFNTEQFTQANNKVNVNVSGFGRYVLRCPFIPKALVIGIDADTYAYTLPVGEVPAGGEDIPPYVQGNGPTNPETIEGRLRANAMMRHGFYTNLVKQFMLMSMGIRVEFDCDNVVTDQPMRAVGAMSSNIACEGTQSLDTYLADLKDLNRQLADDGSEVRYLAVDNATAACSSDVLEGALAQQISAVPNNCSLQGDGTLPLACVPILSGTGLDIILYTLPGQEQSRDEMLAQACSDPINPGFDLPTAIVATSLSVRWFDAGNTGFGLAIAHGDEVTLVGPNELIPLSLLEVTRDAGTGTFTVLTKFPTWAAAAPAAIAGAPTYPPGTDITALITVFETPYDVGSAEQKVINHGRLQISFNIYGSFIRRSDLAMYFKEFAIKNYHLRKLMTERPEIKSILDAAIAKNPAQFGVRADGKSGVGVGSLPEMAQYEADSRGAKEDERLDLSGMALASAWNFSKSFPETGFVT